MDFAARVIHGILPEAVMKTRIRRLYDIANILQSLQLIQKVQVTEANGIKKPAFQYIGPDLDAIGNLLFFVKKYPLEKKNTFQIALSSSLLTEKLIIFCNNVSYHSITLNC